MISKFFIDRPIFAAVISFLFILLGAVSYFSLPVAQYPELAPPDVRVEALYPGASAQVIADTVAAPLEQEINGVDRMIYMNSTSSDGRYQLDVYFQIGADVDLSAVLVQNRVSVANPKLPEDVRRQGVTVRKQSSALIGVLALSSPDGLYDDLYLSNYMTITVKDEISRIYGVGGVNVFPNKDYGMRVWLDPERLKARGLTVNEVRNAIAQQNVQVAAGAVGRQPAPKDQDFEFVVNTKGRLTQPEEFAEIIVKTVEAEGSTNALAGGGASSVVRIKDIGRVELGAKDYNTLATFNGKPAAIMPIYQLPGANLVDVAAKVQLNLDRIRKDLPEGVKAEFFYDSSMFIRASLHEVNKTLIEAFILVFLVVLVFLQSFRTTLIPALTIPVSLIGTFLFLNLFGFSINMLTMFGLVLAIGIVVDDAIVVVENVERNMTVHHLSPRDATIRAMKEITGPIIAITLVLMAVFVPTALLPGITGQMYRQFALTIAASTGISAICALTLSPALCALILTVHKPGHKGFILFRPISALARLFNHVFDALTSAYGRVVRRSIRFWPVSLVIYGALIFATVVLFNRTPTGFVPNEDLGFLVVAAQLPDAAALPRTQEVCRRVSAEVQQVDGVAGVVMITGVSVIDGQGTNFGTAYVVLKPWDERIKSNRPIDAVMNDIRARVGKIQEAQFLVFGLPAISGLGNASGFDLRLQDKSSIGRAAMQQSIEEVTAAANAQSGLAAVYSGYRAAVPQLFLDIDREKAVKLGIPLSDLFQTLQTYLGSAYINDFNVLNRTFQVNVQADHRFRLRPDDILKLEVRNITGQMVPLATLLTVRDTLGPDRISRYNLYPSAAINGSPAPGSSSGVAMNLMEQLATDKLPRGVGYEWTGMSYEERQSGGQALIVFALGLLIVYLILAAQYEAVTTPLAVVLSIPVVVAGAMTGVLIRGLDNNIFTQIGLVLLIGLGAKNAILIVEFARESRLHGATITEAAITAAKSRFRPILMTSLAFILGVVPLMLASGAGANGRQALGTAVFSGMVGNTILGLLFTPVLYVAVQWLGERFRKPKFVSNQVESGTQVIHN